MSNDPMFDRAIAIVLVNEGGSRYTDPSTATPNNPIASDRGGPTRYGITLATLSAWRKKPVTNNDVRMLTETEARDIYLNNYWKPLRCNEYGNQAVATAVVDAGVVSGISNAARQLQTAVGVTVDGAIGPKSLAAIKAADPVALVAKFSQLMQGYMVAIVKRDASQTVFLVGWLKRVAVMQAMPFLLA